MSRIPLSIPSVGEMEGKNLQACIETGFVSYAGAFVSEFEQFLAEDTGAKRAVALSAGTTALHAGLVALGVQPSDLVIVPTLTFIASPNSVVHCAALPWLLDCDADNWLLDPELLAHALATECERQKDGSVLHKASNRRVSAIMPVYVLGVPADIDGICDVAEEWGLPVLADAAAALGAQYKNKKIGQTRAQLSAMSFNANKIITTGGGGALISNDDALMDRVHHMTTTARIRPGYDHDVVGFNYRMTNVQAAIGVAQMNKLPDFLQTKTDIAKRYREGFAHITGASGFPEPAWAQANHWLSGVYLNGWDQTAIEDLRAKLQAANVEVPPFWKPIHMQKPYAEAPTTLTGAADTVWHKIMPLPCSTSLTSAEQDRVIELVAEFAAAL